MPFTSSLACCRHRPTSSIRPFTRTEKNSFNNSQSAIEIATFVRPTGNLTVRFHTNLQFDDLYSKSRLQDSNCRFRLWFGRERSTQRITSISRRMPLQVKKGRSGQFRLGLNFDSIWLFVAGCTCRSLPSPSLPFPVIRLLATNLIFISFLAAICLFNLLWLSPSFSPSTLHLPLLPPLSFDPRLPVLFAH